MTHSRSVPRPAVIAMLSGSMLTFGCASLPASGPTAGQIVHGATSAHNDIGFSVVDIDRDAVQRLQTDYANYKAQQTTLVSLGRDGRNDVVGPGDVLTISVYEVGVSLFGTPQIGSGATSLNPSAHSETFPAVTVAQDGTISLPYVSRLSVAGLTLPEIQSMVAHAYHGESQSPQVLVALKTNVAETVYVSGEVRKPGAIELSLKGERLLDAIAIAGGINTAPEDTVIRFSRNNRTIEERFDLIRAAAGDDLPLIPGDRIEVIKRPRTFLVLGATAKVSQVPFETSEVSLAEALARVGGPSDAIANPAGVFVFRYEKAPDGSATSTPVIYRVNMLRPESYFLTQRFAINDKDIIYISNAPTNALQKLVSILSQLFSPAIALSYAVKQ